MRAMVFAAGLGTRLRPLTDTVPKALVEVGGVPMLEKVILRLKAAGFTDFVVNTCYLADKIAGFLASKGNFGVRIDISEEPGGPYETGGGIKHAGNLLRGDRFLVHNVDILSDVDLRWFVSEDRPGNMATLLVSDFESERRLLFGDDMILRGWMNLRTGEVRSPFRDLDPDSCHKYSFCGIHILSDEVLDLMDGWPPTFSIIDFYLANAVSGRIAGVRAPGLRLLDIGTPESLAAAQESGL